jgi:ATP-binding cassette subfamily B protein
MKQLKYSDFAIYLRLFRHAKPLWPLVLGLFLLNLVAAPLAWLTPLPLNVAVDSVIGDHRLPEFLSAVVPGGLQESKPAILVLAIGLTIGIGLLIQLQSLANWVCQTYASEKLVLDFRSQLFRHAQRLSLLYHDRKGTADAIYRIQYDASAIQWVLVYGIAPFVTAVCTLVGMVYITARINLQLAVVALAILPILFLLSETYRRRIRTKWSELKEVETSTLSVLEETLGAIRVVQAFGQEERQQKRYIHKAHHGIRRHVYLSFLDGSFGALVGVTIACGTAATLWVGVRNVQSGALTLGQLFVVMAYIAQIYVPMKTISGQLGTFQSSLAGAERAFALLDEIPDVADRVDGRHVARAEGNIEFRNVSFSYEGDQRVLQQISFRVSRGTRIGIRGKTGAGKTTLVSLLTRFYDPLEGAILLDDVDLREYRLGDLRNQFAIVLQEPVLFSNSVAENISYARPRASEEEIAQAAKAANAHDFIIGLPNGYETLVGQRGARLSGGERQRISLARAFLKDAPILVLDEPTSSVDLETERIIMEAMERLMSGRTTFMIAHRLSTLEKCDLNLHLEHGQLVEV